MRFSDSLDSSDSSRETGGLYALDDDLTKRLSSIKLNKKSEDNESKSGMHMKDNFGEMFRDLTDDVSRMDIQDTF